jgi:hypothetical protein
VRTRWIELGHGRVVLKEKANANGVGRRGMRWTVGAAWLCGAARSTKCLYGNEECNDSTLQAYVEWNDLLSKSKKQPNVS